MTTPAPAEDRGRLVISGHAVARITAHAAREIDAVGGAAGRVLGLALGSEDADRPVQADAEVDGGRVRLAARLSVTYPASVARTTERARAHLRDRVGELTGLDVTRVDITVTALHPPAPSSRRVS
ncbi:Asp23/Gls24 family envelope stress response protein [Amycolatopsis sp. NPDC004169]|uniref:Asp23/Gls24 family envelope stress response protein n=1 Tax=Amycolatopsis sp. NPDC004169 TaxID=3154453 RepID=UPI0033AE2581